jgi:hypothetical protein
MDWHINCPRCGFTGLGVQMLAGSDSTEKALRYCLLLPGVFYHLWRKSKARTGCPQCGWNGSTETPPE